MTPCSAVHVPRLEVKWQNDLLDEVGGFKKQDLDRFVVVLKEWLRFEHIPISTSGSHLPFFEHVLAHIFQVAHELQARGEDRTDFSQDGLLKLLLPFQHIWLGGMLVLLNGPELEAGNVWLLHKLLKTSLHGDRRCAYEGPGCGGAEQCCWPCKLLHIE